MEVYIVIHYIIVLYLFNANIVFLFVFLYFFLIFPKILNIIILIKESYFWHSPSWKHTHSSLPFQMCVS